jgi:endoglycosylceramidase
MNRLKSVVLLCFGWLAGAMLAACGGSAAPDPATAAASAAGSAAAGPSAPLGHAGRWITDADGRVVVLHGFNMVYKSPPYDPAGGGFGDDDAAFIAGMQFNAVRVGVYHVALEPQPGAYDDNYLDSIADTVAMLGRHGLLALLDFHQDMYNQRYQGLGLADWAALDDSLPPQPQLGFPLNYFFMPALETAYDSFWANRAGPGGVGIQDRYAAALAHVAARFKGTPNVLGYELFNEPWPGVLWEPCVTPAVGCPLADATLGSFVQRATKAIRQNDPTTLIWYEPYVLFNDGFPTSVPKSGDAETGFAFHDYCLNTSNNDTCNLNDAAVFANAEAQVKRTGDALLMTEFGDPNSLSNHAEVADRADAAMVSWLYWSYNGSIVSNLNDPPTGSNMVGASRLAILTRPYPQLVSGTPLNWNYDSSTQKFSFSYSTARADGSGSFAAGAVTQIAAPAQVYTQGYTVQVQGGSVVSAPNAPVLQVAAAAGATTVSVTVAP